MRKLKAFPKTLIQTKPPGMVWFSLIPNILIFGMSENDETNKKNRNSMHYFIVIYAVDINFKLNDAVLKVVHC